MEEIMAMKVETVFWFPERETNNFILAASHPTNVAQDTAKTWNLCFLWIRHDQLGEGFFCVQSSLFIVDTM